MLALHLANQHEPALLEHPAGRGVAYEMRRGQPIAIKIAEAHRDDGAYRRGRVASPPVRPTHPIPQRIERFWREPDLDRADKKAVVGACNRVDERSAAIAQRGMCRYPLVGDAWPIRMRDRRRSFGELRVSGKDLDARGVRKSERAQNDRVQGDSVGQQRLIFSP